MIVKDGGDSSKGVLFGDSLSTSGDTLRRDTAPSTPSHGSYASQVRTAATGAVLVGFSGKLTTSGSSVKISALRSATALQKYREIQNSNDPDFANQVLSQDRKSVV